jgi:cytochrome c oxidase subunit 3
MTKTFSISEPKKSPSGVRGIHPHKFTMWMALGSICMMFAGLTSAYIVKRNQGNWLDFDIPIYFWYSTFVILLSSITFYLAVTAFKERAMGRYKTLITVTAILGVVFALLQWAGFEYLNHHGVQLLGRGSNPAASFLFVIIALHIVHVLGGVIALLVILFRAYNNKVKTYSTVTLEIAGTYWHFVDLLWIYLLIFFYLIK